MPAGLAARPWGVPPPLRYSLATIRQQHQVPAYLPRILQHFQQVHVHVRCFPSMRGHSNPSSGGQACRKWGIR